MDFINNLLKCLRSASPAELSALHDEYEVYLSRLDDQARTQAIRQVEPVLKELMQQSLARMDSAVTAYEQRRATVAV
ncbi:MAG: hypothetical protein LH609_11785 [Rudanella sp.]|jgi:hypothetical protein|nr:hypothetical protein [Rudanella sp.]